MRFDLANLPNNIATLHRIIASQAADVASEREARAAREAELAAAKSGLLAKTLEIEKLQLQIARLRRVQFGRSSEKITRTIEQLELMLEDLEVETSVPAASAASPAADVEQSSSSKSKRSGRKPLAEELAHDAVAQRGGVAAIDEPRHQHRRGRSRHVEREAQTIAESHPFDLQVVTDGAQLVGDRHQRLLIE